MPSPEIEEFARILVQHVRDAAIQNNDRQLDPDVTNLVATRWRRASAGSDARSFGKVAIPDVVDDTIFNLLNAIDQGVLQLSFTASNGKKVDLANDGHGELGGWYMGSGGWRAMYSQERYVDDFSDLKGPDTGA
jgi:hypothetical protein